MILLTGILPLDNFVGHAHWRYVHLLSRPSEWFSLRALLDLAANVLLYFPLGFFHAASCARRHDNLRLVSWATALSLGVELYQVYCHNRHPSALDLAGNVLGALIGALAGRHGLNRGILRPGTD